ncbi:unnamed protein product [Rhizophagus irregularis]|nr:unnamed protein product [Rhizophagus irregularis]
MFQIKTTQEFRCEYCPKTYSKRSSLRNYLRTHRDQMYLNETGLFGEENTYISHPLQEANRPSMRNEQDLTLEDSYWQDDNDIYGNYDDNPSSSKDLNENLSEISNKTSSNNSDENLNEVSNTNLSDNSGENLSETSNAKSDENISSIESDDDKNYDTIETIGNCSEVQSTVLVDVRSIQIIQETTNLTPTTFPNPAYEAFVQLVTKHKLSDSVANDIIHLFNNYSMDPTATLPSNAKAAQVFLDSIEIPHILYKKMIIMEYNQIQYTLHHRTIFDAIKELLSNKEIFKYCVFDYSPDYITNDKGEQERCYSELYNSDWWGRAQRSINESAKKHAMAKHQLFQRSMNILVIEPIMSVMSDGLDLRTDDGILWCYPFLSVLLGDLPEHHAIMLTYNSFNCKMPCHMCMIPKNELNNPLINHSTIQLRTPNIMKGVLTDGLAKDYSIHKIENPFWKSSFTADEFRAMMRQLVFVIDGIIPTLHKTDYTKKQAKNIDKQLVQLYVDWNKMYIYSRKDKFTESDLKTFKSLIIIWAKGFKKLFFSYSASQLQLPKFHSWVYHIISLITKYGAVNNFTTETYETLHKEYVKNPYQMSNKRDASSQMLRTIQRRCIIKYFLQLSSRSTTSINKQHSKSTMNGEIATFKLSLFDEFITTYKANNVLAPEALEAFNQFIIALNRFFSLLEEFANNDVNYETITIKWYSSAVISSSDSIRANSNWYKQAVFDNISINMHSEEVENYITQDGMCFGKVLMLCSVNISSSNYDTFDLALVQWYDYKDARELEKYGCPWLIQTSQYEFIPVESGVEPVHIIQRFIKNDEFFVNVFMF